ncbi:unnamed protein product [Prorocentrum cordatum]|uniref:Uncharacterized protein n=1 Tax=Prorocentrum cordatum TaxID=2364126 RepID=A0ABN9SY53_9DINO|nr:unnamed protein product [Polarella glacialis]
MIRRWRARWRVVQEMRGAHRVCGAPARVPGSSKRLRAVWSAWSPWARGRSSARRQCEHLAAAKGQQVRMRQAGGWRCTPRSAALAQLMAAWRWRAQTIRAFSLAASKRELHAFQACWLAWRLSRARREQLLLAGSTLQARAAAGARQLAAVLGRACRRQWVGEAEWISRASGDPTMQAMFARFAHAVEGHGGAGGESPALRPPAAARRDAFRSLLELIWARRQLSVALRRAATGLRPGPGTAPRLAVPSPLTRWVLGAWPGEELMPAAGSPCHQLALRRLRHTLPELGRGPPRPACALGPAGSSSGGGGGPWAAGGGGAPAAERRALMWGVLADLVVVHYPARRRGLLPP